MAETITEEQNENNVDDLAAKAEEDVRAKNLAREMSKKQERAIKFNAGIDEFFENNADFFETKEHAQSVKELLNDSARREELETGKAAVRAKGILELFVKRAENVENLPEAAKERARAWSVMSDSERHEKALSYFDDIIGVASAIKSAERRNRQLEIKNAAKGMPDAWEKKNWEAATKYALKFS